MRMKLREKLRKRDIIRGIAVIAGFSMFIYGSLLYTHLWGGKHEEGRLS